VFRVMDLSLLLSTRWIVWSPLLNVGLPSSLSYRDGRNFVDRSTFIIDRHSGHRSWNVTP